jgi:muramoyltetrapeptide carboxypeptidase
VVLISGTAPIAVVAPCSAFDPVRFEDGCRIAAEAGLALEYIDVGPPQRYLAGTDVARREGLVQALTGDYSAVWALRGGYGLTRILADLPWDRLPRRPVIGFSDVTALFSGLHQAGLGPCVHGPVVHSLSITDEASREHLWRLLAGRDTSPMDGVEWVGGSCQGPLVGGNLCLLAATCGTAWQLDARGCILVLEEVGEPAYKLDRLLQQLASAGVFDGIVGVAVGTLTSCRLPDGADYDHQRIFLEHLGRLGVPVLGECPIGHGAANRAFVWGRGASLGGGQIHLRSETG